MGLISAGLIAPLKFGAKALTTAKPLTGAIIGGAYGGLTTSEYSSNTMARNIFAGAAVGAGIGSVFTRAGRGFMKELGGSVLARGRDMVFNPNKLMSFGSRITNSAVARVGKGIGKMGLSAAGFSINHPYMALGTAAGGMGIAANIINAGSISSQERAQYAIERGTSSPSRQMLINSADGLVFGLHRGRHR